MISRVTDDKEVRKADLISDTNEKEVTAADPKGEHFKQEMKLVSLFRL